jgi:hypothetical protein
MSVIMENETRPDEALDRRDAVAGKLHRRRKQLASVYSGIETKSLPEPVIYTDDAYATKQIERAKIEDEDKVVCQDMELIL